MNPSVTGMFATSALVLLAAAPGAASATQVRYELQGVHDSSPEPVALVGGFTFDTVSSTFSDITIHFASPPVGGTGTGVFDQGAVLYHYATDQFVASDGFGNVVVLNHGANFGDPGTFALTQTGPNSISYVFLTALQGTPLDGYTYDVVNGAIAAVPEPGIWSLLSAGVLGVARLARRRRNA